MGERDRLLDAARALRGELARLDVDDPERVDRELSEMIAAVARGDSSSDELKDLLYARPETRTFAEYFVREGTPPGLRVHRRRAIRPLPGRPQRIAATKWSCPRGDFDFYARSPRDRPPACPTHELPLRRADGGE